MFLGSIFDGELVWARNPEGTYSQVFLIFDAIALKGSSSIQTENLHRRLEVIRNAFDLDGRSVTSPDCASLLAKEGKIICGGNMNGLSFKPKACFPMDQIDTLLRQISTLSYAVDGLIFTPVDVNVCSGTAEHIFKLKYSHTVDLEILSGELLLGQGGGHDTATQRVPLISAGISVSYSEALLSSIKELSAIDIVVGESTIIECELTTIADGSLKLEYLGRRLDKVHPNTVRTMLSTITNLRENIQTDELCCLQRGSSRSKNSPKRDELFPKPVACEPSLQGGAELASVAVGDVQDSQRFPKLLTV